MTVTVEPARESVTAITAVLCAAADDQARSATSVPALRSPADAEAWLAVCGWNMWVVLVAGEPAGWVALHAPDLDEDADMYADYRETDTYLLPRFRGHRHVSAAWSLVFTVLPPGTRLVGEVWADNTASRRRLERDGWTLVGYYGWASRRIPGVHGQCARYVYTVG